ncbi:MAG: hypothetical protein U1E17_05125 [Geminicoccaceae bacterium]
MRHLLLGVSLLTLAMPAAWAQTTGHQTLNGAAAMAPVSGQVALGNYRIFFGFDEARPTPEAQAIVAEAARSYQGGGMARITVAGHTDTVGTAVPNPSHSPSNAPARSRPSWPCPACRPGASARWATARTGIFPVPTGDQVREPRNRRVEIMPPEAPPPVAPMPAPVAEAAPPPPPEKQPNRFGVGVGAVYGHNFGEKDRKNGYARRTTSWAWSSPSRPCRACWAACRSSRACCGA